MKEFNTCNTFRKHRLISSLLFFIFFCPTTVFSIIAPDQAIFLTNIATACQFTWQPNGLPQCGSYATGTDTRIQCNSNLDVTGLSLTPIKKYCGVIPDSFNLFPILDTLIIGYNLTATTTIQTHTKIQIFKFQTSDTEMVFQFLPSFNMPALTQIEVVYATGTLPTNLIPTQLTSFRIYGHPVIGKFVAHFPFNLITPSLTNFFFVLFFPPVPAVTIPPNIYQNGTNLIEFQIAIKGITIPDLTGFYNPPASLITLGLYFMTMTNTILPPFSVTGWGNLISLVINTIGLTGTVPQDYFQQDKLVLLNLENNQLLNVPLNYLGKSKIQQLYIQNTATNGSVPVDLLDGSLTRFSAEGTQLSGIMPDCILCLPNSALTANPSSSQFLFSSGLFTNYNGATAARTCTPVISSFLPVELKSTDFYFGISGTGLGSLSTYFQISMTNSFGEVSNLAGLCTAVKKSRYIECINPNIMGNGNITFIAFNDQNPTPMTVKTFKYAAPVVSYISPAPTLGGTVSIYGSNLMGISTTYSNVTIGDIPCTPVSVVRLNSIIVCEYPPNLALNLEVKVNVKGLVNDYISQPKYSCRPPSVTSSQYVKPNTDTVLTIKGSDFWTSDESTLVRIDEVQCSVFYVNNSVIYCSYPKTPFSGGAKNIQVTVNTQVSEPNSLFEFIDQGYCPSSCSNGGVCDKDLGFCVCNEGFAGPACDQTTLLTEKDFDSDLPILTVTRDDPSNTELQIQILSIFENNNEIDLTDSSMWEVNDSDEDDNVISYVYNNEGRTLVIDVTENINFTTYMIGDNLMKSPNGSYTYAISYTSSTPIDDLRFKFEMTMSPEECESPPYSYAYPTGISYGPSHFMTLVKYNAQWHSRFPLISVLNDGQSYSLVSSEPQSKFGNYTQVIAKIQSSQVKSANFYYDFTLLNTYQNRDPVVEGCDLGEVKSNNGWKIAVGICVPIGAALLGAAGFFIFRQQKKINSTNKLLKQKLSELSQYR